ncbi:MAG: single-stranded-DNA-specific exonuclease RecJ [Bermanella sp.]
MSVQIQRRPIDASLPLVDRILQGRGLTRDALAYSLNGLADFSSLKDIEKAAQLLADAIEQKKRILIVGDFDVDGATSTALAVDCLQKMGAAWVHYLVPNRFEYGYGLSTPIVDLAQKEYQPDLLVTVDNGISSFEGVARAKELGMQVLVTDHHLAADSLPNADAIVNPNQPDCKFPSKNACGCAVIFYVCCALRRHLVRQGIPQETLPNMANYLDLVSLATVADVVPLDDNNRILVEQGLRRIRKGVARPGIQSLLKVAKKNQSQLTSKDFGFALGPRLNAAGRMDDMSIGIDCLLAQDPDRAYSIAQALDELNQDRKQVEGGMQQEALMQLNKLPLDDIQAANSLCLFQADWHQGVIGLLASRLKEKFYRPVIVFAPADEAAVGDEQEVKGSGRSIPGFHLRDALDLVAKRLPHVLSKFGGHAMAAGLSIKKKHIEEFKVVFEEVASGLLTEDLLVNVLMTDGTPAPQDFNVNMARELRFVAPWGQNFPEPLFDAEFEVVNFRLLGSEKNHLKLTLQDPISQQVYDGILFNLERHEIEVNNLRRVHIVFEMDVNEFRGNESLQLMIRHLTPQ